MVNVKNTIDKILEWTLVVSMSLLVVDVLWQVFSRFILQNPSSFTEELARFLLIWVGLLGRCLCGRPTHAPCCGFIAQQAGRP